MLDAELVLESTLEDAPTAARALYGIASEALRRDLPEQYDVATADPALQDIGRTVTEAEVHARVLLDDSDGALRLFAARVMLRLLRWALEQSNVVISSMGFDLEDDMPSLALALTQRVVDFTQQCSDVVVSGPFESHPIACGDALPALNANVSRLTARVANRRAEREALQAREATRFGEWPDECTPGPAPESRQALERDPREPPVLLILGDVPNEVLTTVRARIGTLSGLPIISDAELETARDMQRARRLSEQRVCRRTPSLERILQGAHDNLIAATVGYRCRRRECRLRVVFPDLSVPVTSLAPEYWATGAEGTPVEELALRLEPAERHFEALGNGYNLYGRRHNARIVGNPPNPWLDVRRVLADSATAFNECATEQVERLRVSLRVDASGTVTDASAQDARGNANECFERILTALSFPCLEDPRDEAELTMDLCVAPRLE